MKIPFSKPFECECIEETDLPPTIFGYAWTMTRRDQILISLVSLSIAAISVAPIVLQREIINEAIEGKKLELLVWLCSAFFGVICLRVGLKYLLGIYQNWIAQSVIKAERKRLSKHFAAKEETEIEKSNDDNKSTGVGKAVSVIGREIDTIGVFVGAGISDLVADGFKLVFAIGWMLWIDPRIALLATVFILPQFIVVPLLQRALNKLIRERTDQLRDLSEDVTELREDDATLSDTYFNHLDDIFTNRMKAAAVKFAIKMFVNFLNALAPLSVFAFGGYLFINGETTLGTIVAFATGFDRAAGPIRALVSYYRLASLRNEQYAKISSWKERLNND